MKIVAAFKSTSDKISVCYYSESQTLRLNDYRGLLGLFIIKGNHCNNIVSSQM